MEKNELTSRQLFAYAHWSAKMTFAFPYLGWFMVLMAGLIWGGIALYFSEPEIKSLIHHSGPHGFFNLYMAVLIVLVALFAVSYATVYVVFFIQGLVDKDDDCRRYFVKHLYRKH